MCIARRLMLLAAVAAVAMALTAPSGFAQGSESEPLAVPAGTDLSVAQEGGFACPGVGPTPPPTEGVFNTAGGCVVHGGGNGIVLSGHLWGIESVDSTCNVEFDWRTDGSGTGYLTHHEFTTASTGTCTRKACEQGTLEPFQSEGRPWRAFAFESQTGPPEERLTVLFCVEDRDPDGGNERHCNVTVPFTETTNHRYTFTANDINASGTPRCELNGTFTIEATQVSPTVEAGTRTHVEINHR